MRAEAAAGDGASLAALERAGEKFMAMFDDEAPRRKKMQIVSSATTATASGMPSKPGKGTTEGLATSSKRSRDELDAGAGDAANGKTPKRKSVPSAGTTSRSGGGGVPDPTVVVFSGDRPNYAASQNTHASTSTSTSLNLKRAKKLFMSDSIKRVHEEVRVDGDDYKQNMKGASGGVINSDLPAGEVTGLTGASLSDMRKQVAEFGASGLDKWSRKSLVQKTRVSLGAKAEKGVRTPPTIGVGMWKKNEQREEQKRMEVFDAGGKLSKKARGSRKADLGDSKDKERDRGLAWGQGNFKGGVLTINKRDLLKEKMTTGGATFLVGTKLSGTDGKRKGKGKSGGSKKSKGSRPQAGGKKGKKKW
tara:strand:+ start:7158 stop:8243 length:1086 start_codon:yes stop_codon:yes gene_type:complete